MRVSRAGWFYNPMQNFLAVCYHPPLLSLCFVAVTDMEIFGGGGCLLVFVVC